jgi:hypothetical protein
MQLRTSSIGFSGLTFGAASPVPGWNFSILERMRAAMTPRWSKAIVLAALLSVWLTFTSSKDDN